MNYFPPYYVKQLCYKDITYHRALSYYKAGRVKNIFIQKEYNLISAQVEGHSYSPYTTYIQFESDTHKLTHCHCTCPAFQKYNGICKHIAALMLTVHYNYDENLNLKENIPPIKINNYYHKVNNYSTTPFSVNRAIKGTRSGFAQFDYDEINSESESNNINSNSDIIDKNFESNNNQKNNTNKFDYKARTDAKILNGDSNSNLTTQHLNDLNKIVFENECTFSDLNSLRTNQFISNNVLITLDDKRFAHFDGEKFETDDKGYLDFLTNNQDFTYSIIFPSNSSTSGVMEFTFKKTNEKFYVRIPLAVHKESKVDSISEKVGQNIDKIEKAKRDKRHFNLKKVLTVLCFFFLLALLISAIVLIVYFY